MVKKKSQVQATEMELDFIAKGNLKGMDLIYFVKNLWDKKKGKFVIREVMDSDYHRMSLVEVEVGKSKNNELLIKSLIKTDLWKDCLVNQEGKNVYDFEVYQ